MRVVSLDLESQQRERPLICHRVLRPRTRAVLLKMEKCFLCVLKKSAFASDVSKVWPRGPITARGQVLYGPQLSS